MSDSAIEKKHSVLTYLNNNIPESPEALYDILYTFKFDDNDIQDILDVFCDFYKNDIEVSRKMLLEYREFYRKKKRIEELEQREIEEQEKLEELRLEMS
ncbi:MAG: hypothetical protein OQL19_18255, partial [Gammaproteobacteria bacterium]|nr:hypothetical protein [Gammaproteobacteria bacterium]